MIGGITFVVVNGDANLVLVSCKGLFGLVKGMEVDLDFSLLRSLGVKCK